MEVEIFLLFVLSQFFSRKKKKKPNFKVCASSMYSLLTDRNLNSRFLTTTRHLLLRRLHEAAIVGVYLLFLVVLGKKSVGLVFPIFFTKNRSQNENTATYLYAQV